MLSLPIQSRRFGNKLASLLVLAAAMTAAFNYSPAWARHRAAYRYCDPQAGDAVRPDIQTLNRLKNRESLPTTKDFDRNVSLAAMLRPGNDERRWDDHKAAQLLGYAIEGDLECEQSLRSQSRWD